MFGGIRPSNQWQERREWIASEGLVLKGKSLQDQKKCMIRLCSEGKVASVEARLLRALCPSERATIVCKEDIKDFTGIYMDEGVKITKTFSSMALCIGWLNSREACHQSKSAKGEASSSSGVSRQSIIFSQNT